jgi:sugar O-acyltransferase (sialic acid O-acetyltransferase NeuD family)
MSRDKQAIVFGGGGHAKVVISTLQACGYVVAAVFDDDAAKWGTKVMGVPVAGPLAAVEEASCRSAVIAVGNNETRKKLAGSFDLEWLHLAHPAAYVHSSVQLGAGTIVFAGSVIQPDAVLGDHAIVNTAATIDHDCEIGNFVHLAPGVHLAGEVEIAEGAFIGINSSALPGIRIGSWTTVGAGAVVVRDLPNDVLAFGVPARPRSRSKVYVFEQAGSYK